MNSPEETRELPLFPVARLMHTKPDMKGKVKVLEDYIKDCETAAYRRGATDMSKKVKEINLHELFKQWDFYGPNDAEHDFYLFINSSLTNLLEGK